MWRAMFEIFSKFISGEKDAGFGGMLETSIPLCFIMIVLVPPNRPYGDVVASAR